MATGEELRNLALALPGVVEKPHFDHAAFVVARTFVTLAADGLSANFKFTTDEQALKCEVASDVFAPVPNAWGAQGWTVARLDRLTRQELGAALEIAWRHAQPKPRKRK